jgi:hypothetical protein
MLSIVAAVLLALGNMDCLLSVLLSSGHMLLPFSMLLNAMEKSRGAPDATALA